MVERGADGTDNIKEPKIINQNMMFWHQNKSILRKKEDASGI